MEYLIVLSMGLFVLGVIFLIAKKYRESFRYNGGNHSVEKKEKDELVWPLRGTEPQPEREDEAEQGCEEEQSPICDLNAEEEKPAGDTQ